MICIFGEGDLWIVNDSNINYKSWSGLGGHYESPSAYDRYSLAGSKYFKVLEIEVY